MEYLPQPVMDPEDYPTFETVRRLKPYHAPEYGLYLLYLKDWVTDYKNLVHCARVCPGNAPPGECRPCITITLNLMALQIGRLLDFAPSSDLPTEYDDLRKLLQLSKEFLQVEGDMGQWIWYLIDRKCQSLEGSWLAKQMSMALLRRETRVFVHRNAYLQGVARNKQAIKRALAELIEQFGAVPQKCVDLLISDLFAAGVPVDGVVAALQKTLDIDVQLLPDPVGPVEEGAVDSAGGVVSNNLGMPSDEEVDMAPAPSSMEGIEEEGTDESDQPLDPELPHTTPNNVTAPASGPGDDDTQSRLQEEATQSIQDTQGSVADQDSNCGNGAVSSEPVKNGIEHGPPAQATKAIQNTDSLELDTVDRDMDHKSAPVASTTREATINGEKPVSEPVTTPDPIVEEEGPVEDAFYSSRRSGLEFNVMEREPGEVRAPAPPQPRMARWYC
ncbi:MAG: hypothetical protein Q9226_003687 [Calogaya cf. arnoldii]